MMSDFSNTGFAHLISITPMKRYILSTLSAIYLGDYKVALIVRSICGSFYATDQGSVQSALIQGVFA